MKKEKQKPKMSEFLVGMGISAGILGMTGYLMERYMKQISELMRMDGISVKEVIAGMVSAYNDILKEKDEEIKLLQQTVKDRELELKGFEGVMEDNNKEIKELQEKLKLVKSEKKKEKKNVKGEKDAKLQTTPSGFEPTN